MSQYQEDMIFKNVGEEDARILLDIIGKQSKKVKIWTKELRLLDPTTFKPDIILELDDEILIIEFQSTKVEKKHHRRFHIYVAITDYNVENHEKEVIFVFLLDKFVENENTRNILQDLLGGRMSMIHEYGERKKNNEQERIIRNLLQSGHSPFEIAKDTRVPLSKVNAIKRKYHL